MQSFWHRVFRTNKFHECDCSEMCAPIRLVKLMPNAVQWDMHGKRFWVLRVSMPAASLLSFFSLFSFLFGSGTTARTCRVSAQWQPRSCRQRAMAKSLRPVNRKKREGEGGRKGSRGK